MRSTITDEELNQNIKFQIYDPLVRYTLLWMFPRCVRPNHVTVVRFLGSPIVFWLLWQQYYRAALIAFIITAATDAIDGTMARTRRQITVWGTIYDSVADKCLIGGVMLILVVQRLDWWLAASIVSLELLAVVGALYYKWTKGVLHQASGWGKIKMNLHVAGAALLLVDVIWYQPLIRDISFLIFVISLAFSIVNIVVHVKQELTTTRV